MQWPRTPTQAVVPLLLGPHALLPLFGCFCVFYYPRDTENWLIKHPIWRKLDLQVNLKKDGICLLDAAFPVRRVERPVFLQDFSLPSMCFVAPLIRNTALLLVSPAVRCGDTQTWHSQTPNLNLASEGSLGRLTPPHVQSSPSDPPLPTALKEVSWEPCQQ